MGLKSGCLLLFAFLLLFLSVPDASANQLLFYEGFDNLSSVSDNGGTLYGSPGFVSGVINNAINLSGTRKICYPIPGNFDDMNGTIEFWVKIMPDHPDNIGLFDIGRLVWPNSWGIFKNLNYLIMEVKNENNVYDQAWSPNSWPYNGRWHFVGAAWERIENYTYFKVFLDGEGKEYYDGIMWNSYPNMTAEFCIGWNQWYGYSYSFFDEFRIFDYAKSNQEVMQDYLSEVNYTRENRTRKECVMHKPESTGPVRVNCTGLYVNDEPFTARGVGYQPIPIGLSAAVPPGANVTFNTPGIYNRDFPLLRAMNANTIRTWARVTNRSFLDAAWNNGVDPIYVVMGFWINCGENYGDPAVRQKYLDEFSDYVAEYKDHPAVLAWALGNENNLGYCSYSSYIDDFYSLANELARVAYEIEGEGYHPVGVVNGDLFNIGIEYYKADDESMNYTDFWGSNVYTGYTFGEWFEDYAAMTGKPLLITEYGIDALNNTSKQEYEDVHSEWVLRQWREIDEADMTIGSSLMAYSDEWWKAGYTYYHDYGGYETQNHPDGYSNEEWWGVMRVVDNGSSPDIMEPRQLYYDLRDEWEYRADIHVNPAYRKASVGGEFTIDIDINTTEEVYAGQFRLLYNCTVLNATQVLEGDFLKQGGAQTFPVIITDGTGCGMTLANTRMGVASGATGAGTLATITFSALEAGLVLLDLQEVVLSDPLLNSIIPLEVVDGLVKVTYLEGDVDGNCVVNIFDLASVGLAYGSKPGDSNWNPDADVHPLGGNGVINIFDLATVGLNYGKVC